MDQVQSDQAVLLRIQLGDHAAIVGLYARCKPVMAQAMRSRFGGTVVDDDIDDAIHDAFARFLSRAALLDATAPQNLKSYLVTSAINKHIDRLRSARYRASHEERSPAGVTDLPGDDGREGERVVAQGEERRLIERALAEIPWQRREAIEMRYFDDLSVSEIAERMGLSYNIVRGILQAGRRDLAAVLGRADAPLGVGVLKHRGFKTRFDAIPAARRDRLIIYVSAERPRQALTLVYLDGLSGHDAAAAMSVQRNRFNHYLTVGRKAVVGMDEPAAVRPAARGVMPGLPLSRTEYLTLRYLALGVPVTAINQIMGRPPSASAVPHALVRARGRLGVRTTAEAVAWMTDRLIATEAPEAGLLLYTYRPVDLSTADTAALAKEVHLLRGLLRAHLYAAEDNRTTSYRRLVMARTRRVVEAVTEMSHAE